jgi:sulfoxide reductase heme-binding subunit YedZ
MALRLRDRRRLFGVAVLVLVLAATLALWAFPAFAADAVTVPMQGQGTVLGGGESASQLRLKLTAADGSDWLLEMTLNPTGARRSSTGLVVYSLSGSFVLGQTNTPLANGTATGTMDQNGNGDIRLAGSSGPTSLDVPFTVTGNGNLTAQVAGTWPVLPSAAGADPAPATPPVNHFWWYLSRAAGLVSYILLFLSIAFGLGLRSNQSGQTRRRVVLELHQFLAVLGLAFLGLHIGALLGDSYINFSIANLLLPVALPYRAAATAAGIFGMYGFVVVFSTFLVRRWVGKKTWRAVHGAAIVMFVLVLVHSITAGTDTIVPWVRWMYTLSAGATVGLAIMHYFRQKRAPVAAAVVSRPSGVQRPGSR